jgi:DNA polymerase-3 subunit epsilon
MSDRRLFVGLDTETTGLDWSKGDRVIELAGVVFDPTGQRLAAMIQRFNPERAIHAGAQAVHGIGYEELVAQPKFHEKADRVRKLLLAAEVIVIHNAPFDLAFVLGELQKAGVLQPGEDLAICAKTIDTCEGARWATANGKSPSLSELCFACGVEYDDTKAHAAEYDVTVMMQAFFKGLERGFFTLPVVETQQAAEVAA